jgi:DNA segregation ATPase FtsK/SpoIIIE, S-DNA-T family
MAWNPQGLGPVLTRPANHMAKSTSSNSNSGGPSFQPPRYRPRWLVASLCFVLGVLITVALVDFAPEQSEQVTTNPDPANPNLVGRFGSEFSWWSLHIFGASTWLIPAFLLWSSVVALRNAKRLAGTRFTAMVVSITTNAGLWAMWESFGKSQYFSEGPGGILGQLVYDDLLKSTLGVFGSALLLTIVSGLGLMFIFTRDITAEFEKAVQAFQAWREQRALAAAERDAARLELKEQQAKARAAEKAESIRQPLGAPTTRNLKIARATDEPLAKPTPALKPAVDLPPPTAFASKPAPEAKPKIERLKSEPTATATDTQALAVATGKLELNIVKPEETKKAKVTVLPQSNDEHYTFPPLSILKEQVRPSAENSEEEHARNAQNLMRILSEFGVEVTLGEIHVGPVITRYEVAPAAGVRVEKIAGLDKNIALGMRAQSVRILAPIPGKAAVGVEVPNQHPTPVGMREILEAEDWVGAKAELPIALGKDVSGKPLISDLTKMPHLLIAGATGSGKSVCINSIVASILYSKSPKDVRLLMVDPKVVELKIFNSLPHMLIPVVTEPKKVPGALKWLLNEMEQRYQMFAKCNVRNIVGFNGRKKGAKPDFPSLEQQGALQGVDPSTLDDGEPLPERLPYIVAIIDELADLMMVAPAEIETSIARLAQLARAAGIHLIIATQRPSVNVITGVIKANLPSRIAFQVASQVDSRTILDTKGADTLIGRGDMLFSPPGSSRLVRAQGAFVSDEEVLELVEFLKVNGPPQYATSVQQQIDRAAAEEDEDGEGGGDDGDMGDDEELFQQALDVLKSTKRASTSMIQRRLRIGYNRAARIMDLMEDKGIVGPENGSSPREILKDLDTL